MLTGTELLWLPREPKLQKDIWQVGNSDTRVLLLCGLLLLASNCRSNSTTLSAEAIFTTLRPVLSESKSDHLSHTRDQNLQSQGKEKALNLAP